MSFAQQSDAPGANAGGATDRATQSEQRRTGNTGGSSQMGQSNQMGQMDRMGLDQAEQQEQRQLRQIAQDPPSAPDKLFVLHAAEGNLMEIQLGQIAQRQSQNQQVKQFAQTLVQDHQQANERLQQAAQALNVELPRSLSQSRQLELQIFSKLSSQQFDGVFTCHMLADHAKDVTQYTTASAMAQNDQVKNYASQTLPRLQQHYQQAQQIAGVLGIPTSSLTGAEATPAGARMNGDGNGAAPRSGMGGADTGDRTTPSR